MNAHSLPASIEAAPRKSAFVTQRSDRLLIGMVVGTALLSALGTIWATGNIGIAVGFAVTLLGSAALMLVYRRLYPPIAAASTVIDWTLTREAADNEGVAIAMTDRQGRLVCANDAFGEWFQGFAAPPGLPVGVGGISLLAAAGREAWRDGQGVIDLLEANGARFAVRVLRSGHLEDHLVWRFVRHRTLDLRAEARRLIEGEGGDRLGEVGIMVALVGGEGRVRTANRAFIARAAGRSDAPLEGRDFVTLLVSDREGVIRFAHEGAKGGALRLMQVPLESGTMDSQTLLFLIDDEHGASGRIGKTGTAGSIETLLSMLPLGLALTDRDGRFLFLNDVFARAAGIGEGSMPVYPGDLVVREDKAAVADTVRRFGMGQQALSGDMAVRLRNNPEEPVALTIAGARGLGEAAVLLSLKDNSEESRLKRQAEQATKMQAVGQLAGGVAHDFNNILTAIIGHCDLMLMRHAPGDSDYDDIQQIRSNSNRAASLTRQLLAFSRQQTLRPQILQLPDVISEVSNLLKRLLGETVILNVSHGRNLGAVRADPGQLEQVIVNLAVNARDAMQTDSPGAGTLTIQTYAVPAGEVRQIGSEILPIVDYTALKITDTGTGIPSETLPKIFEPFFTTKEIGKGTGLGLSTVYGIVKQSGGFIFAESELGKGTSFTIYLPVHHAERAEEAPVVPKVKQGELWGTGTILLVEDEDMVRAVAERALTRHGYTVLTAANGEEALEVLSGGAEIDLLISDVVMPTMDGPTMVRQARKTWPDLPILFMSGYAEEQLRKSIDLDRVAFLPKPFSVHQLAEAARAALGPK